MRQWFILQYPNGDYAGLDAYSGGYPYRVKSTESPASIKYWPTLDEAYRYSCMSQKEDFKILKVELKEVA